MTTSITKYIILTILSIAMRPGILIQSQQAAPCYFVFGDSLFDNGNNNNLITLGKVNYLPYGIDYPTGPTGRFTNGKNIPDFLAQLIGFTSPVPPYLATAQGGSNVYLKGLNYASGGSGILTETGYQAGDRLWFDRQLLYHQLTVTRISVQLGSQTAGNNLLNQCLYTISFGNNDYLLNYYAQPPVTFSNYLLITPEMFANELIQKYSLQLTTLYKLQARKVAIFGVVPIGCIPSSLSQYSTNGAPCVESLNNAAQIFNTKLISLINSLNANLSGAQFTYINSYSLFSRNLSSIGVKNQMTPCCTVSAQTAGLCVPGGAVCSNRSEYEYFDSFHPTEVVYKNAASIAYRRQSPSDATPLDIATLLQH